MQEVILTHVLASTLTFLKAVENILQRKWKGVGGSIISQKLENFDRRIVAWRRKKTENINKRINVGEAKTIGWRRGRI